jgi:magnesium transporter
MIKARLLAENQVVTGDTTLLGAWRDDPEARLWLDIEGVVAGQVSQLLLDLGCDELAIAVAARDRHPPKVEEFESSTFLLIRGIASLDENLELSPQQIALFVGDRFLVTVHRGHSVSISHYWETVSDDGELVGDPGLLALKIMHYASGRYLDAILDFEDHLGTLEDALLSGSAENAMKDLVTYRSRLRILRRIFSYHQRLAEQILGGASSHLGEGDDEDSLHLHERRSLYDRCERVYSLCTMYYEICGDLVEGHISLSSHRLNNTMKILTIITAIFVPLSFLAGLYGMNFDNIPELHHPRGYFILLGLMATIATGMLILFRRIRWL